MAAQKDKIKKVQINSYLKNIGDYAFYGCDSLESVVIQDSKLTEIGIAAFKNCKNLKNDQYSGNSKGNRYHGVCKL